MTPGELDLHGEWVITTVPIRVGDRNYKAGAKCQITSYYYGSSEHEHAAVLRFPYGSSAILRSGFREITPLEQLAEVAE